MQRQYYARLRALARRWSRIETETDDLVQDALLEAVRQGRGDLARVQNFTWVAGIIRNRARMAARGAMRSRTRDGAWQVLRNGQIEEFAADDISGVLAGLPKSLKAVAALALSGHNRREIAYLLRLSDTALRQRITGLRKALRGRGIAVPAGLPGLNLDLAYGRIRDALLPELLRHGGIFASHDPDGHLFIVRAPKISGAGAHETGGGSNHGRKSSTQGNTP
jgi:DNA-directed RNA polymerase specialized sigma24 family protein